MSASEFFAGTLPRTFGHRGAAGTVPENTRPSFAAALEHGAAGLELDVHRTADGEIVVLHDDLLDRTTDGIGPVRARTLAELRALDAGARFSPDGGATFPYAGRGIGISTLREVLEDHPETPFIVEIKQVDPPLEEDLAQLLRTMAADGRTLVFSLHQEAVDRYRALGTGRPTGFGPADVAAFLDRLKADDWDGYEPPGAALAVPTHWAEQRLVTRPFVDAAHRLGLEVFVWTVNDPAEMESLLDLGVDGLISDHPELLTRVVAERADRGGRR